VIQHHLERPQGRARSRGDIPPQRLGGSERLVQVDSVLPGERVVAVTERGAEEIWPQAVAWRSLSLLPVGGAQPLLEIPAASGATFSPDGRWLAYLSGQTGPGEVYLRPTRGPVSRILVSASAGWQLAWAPDGRELYYRVANRIMRVGVDVSTGRVSPPAVLFESPFTSFRGGDVFRAQYDVARDGRFLMVRSEGPRDQVRVVLNLHTALRQPGSGSTMAR